MNSSLKEADAVVIILDGWSNIKGDNIIGVIVLTPQPYYFGSIDCRHYSKTADFMMKQIIQPTINACGKDKVIAIVGDNASVMKRLGQEVNQAYPHIFFQGCAAHMLSLFCHDILRVPSLAHLFNKLNQITSYIKDTKKRFSLFKTSGKTFCDNYNERQLGGDKRIKLTVLLRYCKTRFYSVCNVLSSYVSNELAIKNFFKHHDRDVADAFSDEDIHMLVEEPHLWTDIKIWASILKPISKAIGELESDSASISQIPEVLNSLRELLPDLLISFSSEIMNDVMQKFDLRSKQLITPQSLLANRLDPRFKGENLTQEQQQQAEELLCK